MSNISIRHTQIQSSSGVASKVRATIILRVQVPDNQVLGYWVIVVIVQVLGKYRIVGYLDPEGEQAT